MASHRVPATFFRLTALFIASLASTALTGCGGYSAPSNSTPVSKIKERVFISNASAQQVLIADGSNDTLSTFSVTVSGTPTQLLESKDKSTTVAYDNTGHGLDVIDNATETQTVTATLPDGATSIVLAPSGTKAFAAIPTATCAEQPPTVVPPGAVAVVDLTSGTITNCVAVANADGLAISHNGNTLLVFSRNSNVVGVINPASLGTFSTPISDPHSLLDHPGVALFSSDDSTAYILSCGAECGGAAANITTVSIANSTLGTSVPVAAAREGLLNGGTLYVAGSNGNSGSLEVVNPSSLTVQKTVSITDGLHDTMALTSTGKLFIGARQCDNTATGCLSIYDTAGGSVRFSTPNPAGDDITGMEPIPNRNVIYVCEGGELIIYDTTTDTPQAKQFDVVGDAADVREVF